MKRRVIIALLALLVASGCGGAAPGTLVGSGYDENEMDAAIARARSEVESFIRELAHPTGSDHAVKAPIEHAGKTEHFWLIDVSFENGAFRGTINNEPSVVSNVKLGQSWSIRKTDISDWMFLRGGKMYGNYTIRPLLKTMPKNEAAAYRSLLADPES